MAYSTARDLLTRAASDGVGLPAPRPIANAQDVGRAVVDTISATLLARRHILSFDGVPRIAFVAAARRLVRSVALDDRKGETALSGPDLQGGPSALIDALSYWSGISSAFMIAQQSGTLDLSGAKQGETVQDLEMALDLGPRPSAPDRTAFVEEAMNRSLAILAVTDGAHDVVAGTDRDLDVLEELYCGVIADTPEGESRVSHTLRSGFLWLEREDDTKDTVCIADFDEGPVFMLAMSEEVPNLVRLFQLCQPHGAAV